MNVAGPLASLIFGITVLTVFGGLFAYGVYKARERTRKKPSGTKRVLHYFVEFTLPEVGTATNAIAAPVKAPDSGRPWALYGLSFLALLGFSLAGVHYIRSGRSVVQRGAWDDNVGPSKEFPPPPQRPIPDRGPPVSLTPLLARYASVFPKPGYDTNGDGIMQISERSVLQREVPQFIEIVVDDGGQVQGLSWLYETLLAHRAWGETTFFLTANYLEGKSNHVGGPVSAWWKMIAAENYVGLHGETHGNGASWTVEKWLGDDEAALRDIQKAVPAPGSWTWANYPWGARAPYLSFSDAYFTALERAPTKILYDASMVLHPNIVEIGRFRDQTWPFSLQGPLPPDAELPYVAKEGKRVSIGAHAILEAPVYAWAIDQGGGTSTGQGAFIPSLDLNLFERFPCQKDEASRAGVETVLANLKSHYEGNRAPFHIGLHAQNYSADHACERKTIEEILRGIERLQAGGYNLVYSSPAKVFAWMAAPRGG